MKVKPVVADAETCGHWLAVEITRAWSGEPASRIRERTEMTAADAVTETISGAAGTMGP
jgi:hypothetical protein